MKEKIDFDLLDRFLILDVDFYSLCLYDHYIDLSSLLCIFYRLVDAVCFLLSLDKYIFPNVKDNYIIQVHFVSGDTLEFSFDEFFNNYLKYKEPDYE